MSASKRAKELGCISLDMVAERTGYSVHTLHRYYKTKEKRFKALCLASICDELGVDGNALRKLHAIGEMVKNV